ncbi:MAG: alpha/beta hydrolase [Erysipelotrichaceae bacterium]|nr:alpha/beta hydrolase [Erysipelotrichaceae bacterium]
MLKKALLVSAAAFLAYRLNAKGHTRPLEGENSIAELKSIRINDTDIWATIRGQDKNNPVLLCVTGGPCGTEIPLIEMYEKELEKHFTIVHYDQRGAGKSFSFFKDYSDLTYEDHVNDLIALSEYLCTYLNKEKIYLLGHSYGTFLATVAASRRPDLYEAYVGIGQMSDVARAESYSLESCIEAAKEKGNTKDAEYLESIREKVKNGETICPRNYVRKYGFAEHEKSNAVAQLVKSIVFGPEYNIMDGIKFFYSAAKHAMPLAMQCVKDPLPELVKEIKVPTYFLLGKYDGMTNTKAAREYFDELNATEGKQFIIFDNSAHSPQVEENEKFVEWMSNDLLDKNKTL